MWECKWYLFFSFGLFWEVFCYLVFYRKFSFCLFKILFDNVELLVYLYKRNCGKNCEGFFWLFVVWSKLSFWIGYFVLFCCRCCLMILDNFWFDFLVRIFSFGWLRFFCSFWACFVALVFSFFVFIWLWTRIVFLITDFVMKSRWFFLICYFLALVVLVVWISWVVGVGLEFTVERARILFVTFFIWCCFCFSVRRDFSFVFFGYSTRL